MDVDGQDDQTKVRVRAFHHVAWPLAGLNILGELSDLHTQYPIRNLRYWFVRGLLEQHHWRTGRRLSILEVGIGDGRMLGFISDPGCGGRASLPAWIDQWDGLDVNMEPLTRRYAYSNYIVADVERPVDCGGRKYDAIILLHVLEHLAEPEAAMSQLLGALRDDGMLVGGSRSRTSLMKKSPIDA